MMALALFKNRPHTLFTVVDKMVIEAWTMAAEVPPGIWKTKKVDF